MDPDDHALDRMDYCAARNPEWKPYQSLCTRSPDEEMMEREEPTRRDVDAERAEVFNRLLDLVLRDGLNPQAMEARLAGLARAYCPSERKIPAGAAPIHLHDVPAAICRTIVAYFYRDHRGPRAAAKTVVALAKGIAPHMIGDPSLERIGQAFGETRAAVSWRVKQVVNRPVEAAAGVAHSPFQKRACTVEKYRLQRRHAGIHPAFR